MEPRHSILYFKQSLSSYSKSIEHQLMEGVKVFWFGTNEEACQIKTEFKAFSDAYFLQTFDISEILGVAKFVPTIILDGEGIESEHARLFNWLEEEVPAFNAAQYRVEHCAEEGNIVVKASAGTGKTTVMIDRILYLMHTVPNLNMSEIFMITFTNEATNQMNDRLQDMLLKKYSLTKNKRYLTWLEQQSQMHISTIDSLAYELFKRFGSSVGFGRDMQIRPLQRERKSLQKDLLSDNLSDQRAISMQIGMRYSDAGNLIDDYWREMTRKGYTTKEILEKDWGKAGDPTAVNLQKVLRNVLTDFEEKYRQLKLDENAISIDDLFFDFGHFLLDERLSCDGLDLKYLFVDEFQDTDATQIRTFARLVKTIKARLFVVGDVKQSIYAFKGATDEAFDILVDEMNGDLRYYSLRNNYRTCANVMKAMEDYFFKWSKEGLLRYEESVRPFNKEVGHVEMEFIENKNTIQAQTMAAINNALSDLELEVRSGRKKVTDKTKVAVLVRANYQAKEIAELCRKNGRTVVMSSDRPFFRSRAVRDFYAMISSYIFIGHPAYTFNYLMTPYASYDGEISATEMERLNERDLKEYLAGFVSQTKWHEYQREFRLRPVLSVIKDIVEKVPVIENFIALDKTRMRGTEWTDAKRNRQALIDAKSYQKNLDKLMEMIRQRMEGEFATLYDLYVYLTLMIATNRDEMEPDVETTNDYTSVYVMTVHKSKGLEYDTVVMPYMNKKIVPEEKTMFLVGKRKVAWYYKRKEGATIKSAWYDEMREEAIQKNLEEETRMLYVAMTRAVNKLVLLVNNWDSYESWSSLIRRVGLKNV